MRGFFGLTREPGVRRLGFESSSSLSYDFFVPLRQKGTAESGRFLSGGETAIPPAIHRINRERESKISPRWNPPGDSINGEDALL
jgi:hypothetical protein